LGRHAGLAGISPSVIKGEFMHEVDAPGIRGPTSAWWQWSARDPALPFRIAILIIEQSR
jgi:hypothetical protein